MAFRSTIKKRFVSSVPGKQIIYRSRKTVLPGFHGFSVFDVATEFTRQVRKTSLVERASGISFNIVMAIPPTLIFVFTLIPYFPISQEFLNQMYSLIRDVIPGEKNNSVIIDFLKDFVNQPRNELLSFGLFLAIFFSSNAMMGVLRSFDKNYPGFEKRGGFRQRRIALQLTMLVFFLIFICILLLIAQANVLRWLGVESALWRNIIHNSRWILIVLLTFWIVSFIYHHGPPVTRRWPLLTPGAVFATTLMILSTALFSYWVNNFSNYNTVYGSIGTIFILMSLVYANSFAILVGFELNVALGQLQQQRQVDSANGNTVL